MKGGTWKGGFRVPLIARRPGRIPAGHSSAQPAVMRDVFATVLQATGTALPDDRVLDGRDIMPLLTALRARRTRPCSATAARVRPRCGTSAGNCPCCRRPTILAPFEQYNRDAHPAEVQRRKALFDAMNKAVPVVEDVKRVPRKR